MRHSKTVNGATKTHLWDGQNSVAESANGQICARYYRGANLIAWQQDDNLRFYMHNAHGDVVRIVQNWQVLYSYDYDAFGNEKSPNAEYDGNPFRYCGEYYDREIENVYLRARYYDTSTGRFIQEDPACDGLNWYAYCNGNPVKFDDFNGLTMRIVKKGKDDGLTDQTFEYLQKLTNDKLYRDPETGEITITERADNPKLAKGTELVRSIIDNKDHDCKISVKSKVSLAEDPYNRKNSSNGVGSSTEIYFSPNTVTGVLVENDDNLAVYEERDIIIGLAHELIHADRTMRGVKVTSETQHKYTYLIAEQGPFINGETGIVIASSRTTEEEMITVGLGTYSNVNYVTENDIRKEQGFKRRVDYNSHVWIPHKSGGHWKPSDNSKITYRRVYRSGAS